MMNHNKDTQIRLYIDEEFTENAIVNLPLNQIHYLRNVMRLDVGARIQVFNGRDGLYLANLTELAKKKGTAQLQEQIVPQPTVTQKLALCFVPIKKDRQDFMIEKAVELGVTDLYPLKSQHGQVGKIKTERIESQIIEAAEQCERLDMPNLHAMNDLRRFLKAFPADQKLYICAERAKAKPIGQVILDNQGQNACFLIGPEGGFSGEEMALFDEYDFVEKINLGSRILRAETAAVTALASFWACQSAE